MKSSQIYLFGLLFLFCTGLQAQITLIPPPGNNVPSECGGMYVSINDFEAAGGTFSTDCITGAPTLIAVFEITGSGNACPGDPTSATITYTATDPCGGEVTVTQMVTNYQSTGQLVITSILPSASISCGDEANPQATDITYISACGVAPPEIRITGPTIIGQANCPGTLYRYTYTLIDECGRQSVPVTRDFIISNDGPEFTNCPGVITVPMGREPASLTAMEVSDFQSNLEVSFSCDLSTGGIRNNFNPNAADQPITFVATDACNRTEVCTVTVEVFSESLPALGRSGYLAFAFLIFGLAFGVVYRMR